jgi:hypothetical protein
VGVEVEFQEFLTSTENGGDLSDLTLPENEKKVANLWPSRYNN